MNVSYSNTQIKEAETLATKLLWDKPSAAKGKNKAKTIREKLTDVIQPPQWNKINWKKVEAHVNRLQVRIMKAEYKGNRNLVCRLT
ncbi:MAG: reverse transcriptase N-terminal domain-containing protein [Methanosarcinaceae archaeon]|nr:reverse transcriptase N-terminal domain-containing protein [Methanosarcinaceae archaeon]